MEIDAALPRQWGAASHSGQVRPHFPDMIHMRLKGGENMLRTAVRYQGSWIRHALFGRRESLCRPVDRLAAGLSALLLAVAVIAVPATMAFGWLLHHNLSQRASRAAATTQPATAVLTTDAQASVGATDSAQTDPQGVAMVQWNTASGPRSVEVDVPLNSVRGQSIPIWIDNAGNMAPAPADPGSVTRAALFGATGTLLLILTGCLGLIAATQYGARRYAQQSWGREWAAMQRWGTLRQ